MHICFFSSDYNDSLFFMLHLSSILITSSAIFKRHSWNGSKSYFLICLKYNLSLKWKRLTSLELWYYFFSNISEKHQRGWGKKQNKFLLERLHHLNLNKVTETEHFQKLIFCQSDHLFNIFNNEVGNVIGTYLKTAMLAFQWMACHMRQSNVLRKVCHFGKEKFFSRKIFFLNNNLTYEIC